MSNPGPNVTSTPNLDQAGPEINPSTATSGDGKQVGKSATSLVGFWGAVPIAQPAAQAGTPNSFTPTAGAGTTVKVDSTFNGAAGAGGTAYSVGDIVKALKAVGILAT